MIQRMPPVVTAPAPYAAMYTFNWLSARRARRVLLAAIALGGRAAGVRPAVFGDSRRTLANQLAFPHAHHRLACSALAFLMNYSGATATLGLAFAATGALFPFFSALLGWLGVFLTGSDTSANALFGNLQVVTANSLGLIPMSWPRRTQRAASWAR